MRRGLLSLVVVASLASDAAAWGEQGHQAIAEAAGSLLTPKARAAVVKLLGHDDLAAVSVWLDDVRAAAKGGGPLVGNAEARAFNERHPDNGDWHFVNWPLGAAAYTRDPAFAPRHNVVERIAECIRVLEAPPGTRLPMSKAQALKSLVHLVGDLHQPLHVGSGYYEFTLDGRAILVTDPAKARGRPSDRGGNRLRWGPEPNDVLHGDWDSAIVGRIVEGASSGALAAKLKAEAPKVMPGTPGDYRTAWARQWAAETLGEAAGAYRNVVFGAVILNPHHELEAIEIRLLPDRDGYLDKSAAVATAQLTRAAVRLSALLNRIAW
jgi:hypothetical protein